MEIITRKEAKERGLKRYFTGKPCKHGHVSERYTYDAICIACRSEKSIKHYNKNKERRSATTTAWLKINKERKLIINAAWRANNKDRRKTINATWYSKNKKRLSVCRAEWRANNKERISAAAAAWAVANPDKVAEGCRRRRARKRGVPGSHTIAEIKELLVQQGQQCANPHCRADLRVVKKHLDHKNPLSRPETNPTNSIENLQWLCQPCNDSKGAKTMSEFMCEVVDALAP